MLTAALVRLLYATISIAAFSFAVAGFRDGSHPAYVGLLLAVGATYASLTTKGRGPGGVT